MCFEASPIAYSATTVFPALVCAATNTLSPISRWYTASFWNVSNSNGYYIDLVSDVIKNNEMCNTYFVRHIRHKFMKVCKRFVHIDNVRPVAFGHWSRGTTPRRCSHTERLVDRVRIRCRVTRFSLTFVEDRKSSTSAEPTGALDVTPLSCLAALPEAPVDGCVI